MNRRDLLKLAAALPFVDECGEEVVPSPNTYRFDSKDVRYVMGVDVAVRGSFTVVTCFKGGNLDGLCLIDRIPRR